MFKDSYTLELLIQSHVRGWNVWLWANLDLSCNILMECLLQDLDLNLLIKGFRGVPEHDQARKAERSRSWQWSWKTQTMCVRIMMMTTRHPARITLSTMFFQNLLKLMRRSASTSWAFRATSLRSWRPTGQAKYSNCRLDIFPRDR